MKRIIPILLAVMLCAILFVACKPDPTINMTESYSKSRDQFKEVSGIELPQKENLELSDYYLTYYTPGDTDCCFDIIGGSALSYQTYLEFEDFLLEELGECTLGPDGNEAEGRGASWTRDDGRWVQIIWDQDNKAIYINTAML